MRRTVTVLALVAAVLPVGGAALGAPAIDTLELARYSPAQMKLFYQLDGGTSAGALGVDVTGPNGQVTHGSIVSAFIAALREDGVEGGIGCAVSALARTDLGRTAETKVRAADADGVDADAVDADAVEADPEDIALAEVETRCAGSEDEGAATGDPGGEPEKETGHGRPDWAGPGAASGNPGRSRRP